MGMDSSTGVIGASRPGAPLAESRFEASHTLRPHPSGGTRVTYSIRVQGPDAATLGPVVTADLGELLAAIRALAAR